MRSTVKKILYYSSQTIEYYINVIRDMIKGVDFNQKNDTHVPGGEIYEATHDWVLSLLSEYLSSRIKDNDAIVDVGCGKGAMLRFFSGFNFSKIDGIEYSKELCLIAESNMSRLGLNHVCHIINADATQYDAYSDYNYFYLYNPFGEEVMRAFLDRLILDIKDYSRVVTLIYNNPIHGKILSEYGFEDITNISLKEQASEIPQVKVYTYKIDLI